jgi:hypothetical protein
VTVYSSFIDELKVEKKGTIKVSGSSNAVPLVLDNVDEI